MSVAMRDRGVGAAVEADKQTTGLESYLWSCRNFIPYSAEIPQIHVTLHVSCGEADDEQSGTWDVMPSSG